MRCTYESSRKCILESGLIAKDKPREPSLCWVACGGVLWCPRMVPLLVAVSLVSFGRLEAWQVGTEREPGLRCSRHGYLLAGSVGLAKGFEPRLIMAYFTNVSWWVVDGLFEFQLDAKTAHEALLEILAHIWNFRFT
jgi:hypothetical protein